MRNINNSTNECSIKAEIPIAQAFPNDYPMTRSEARRLTSKIDTFEEVILNFKNVENLGQAFAHELFIVFNNNHPTIKLTIKNANAQVNKMIKHVCPNN